MGQKVHPYGFRLGIHTDWKSRWFTEKQYQEYLEADLRIREYLLGELPHAGISRIDIERTRRARPDRRAHRATGDRHRPPWFGGGAPSFPSRAHGVACLREADRRPPQHHRG